MSQNAEPAVNYNNQLTSWESSISEWPNKMSAVLMNWRKCREDMKKSHYEKVAVLEADFQNLRQKRTSEQQATAECEKKLDVLAQMVDEKLRKREQLVKDIDIMKSVNSSLKQDIVDRRQAMEDMNKSLAELEQAYAERLGLKINVVHGTSSDDSLHFEFKFTKLDSKDPCREFGLALKLRSDKTIAATDCQPFIRDLDVLLGQLNKSNDWHHFILKLRRRFVELI